MNPPTERVVREVNGMKVSFISHEEYFAGFHSASMYSVAKQTGANVVLLLGPGKLPEDLSDDDIRRTLQLTGPDYGPLPAPITEEMPADILGDEGV